MIRSVIRNNSYVDDRESSQHSLCNCFFCSLIDSWDKLLRNCTSCYFVSKFIVFLHIFLKVNQYVSELSSTSCLSLEYSFSISIHSNSFSVCYLWFTGIYFYFVFSSQSIYDDFQVQFSHSCDDSLIAFRV